MTGDANPNARRLETGTGLLTLAAAVILAFITTLSVRGADSAHKSWLKSWQKTNSTWRGVHVMLSDDKTASTLIAQMPRLASLGVNSIIVEVNYHLAFDSRPELRESRFLSKSQAHQLAIAARENGIRLIPQFSCLGHQSWRKTTFPLLAKYPRFDETPGHFPNNEGIYCRSWCPRNPEVNKIVFTLIDEIIEAFEADAFHVGMDEVFLIGSEFCPRCHGMDTAKLFAKAVNDLHKHVVGKRKLEMLMWGDRLLNANTLGYGKWESAANGTDGAADLIPKDIIICDWHYEKRDGYPSVPLLLDKGLRVWPSGWKSVDAADAFVSFNEKYHGKRMLGYLATTWGAVPVSQLAEWPPIVTTMKKLARQPIQSTR